MLRRSVRGLALCTVCTSALLPFSGASAQVAGGQAPAASYIEELIVTAQKREQRTLDVPIALTAYTGAFLDEIGVQEFEELSLFVPGFEVQNQSPNNPGFVMRGITSDDGGATVEPRVSVFQDGVSVSKSRGSYIELFDNARIEVAKGPQSTLFGRSALIGAVNIVQNKADPGGFAAAAKFEAGNFNYRGLEAMVNVPLSSTLAVRFAGRVKQRDGFVENVLGGRDFNSTDTNAYRVVLKWQPSDNLDADLIFNYEENNPSGTSFKSLTYLPTDPLTGKVLGDLGRNSGAALASSDGFAGGRDLGLERTTWGVTGLVDYRISDTLRLSSISAFRRFKSLEVFDADGFSLPLFVFAEDARGDQYSQEFRINYEGGERLSAFAGVGYFYEDGSQAVPLQYNERVFAARNAPLAGLVGFTPPNVPSINTINSAAALSTLKLVHRETFQNYGRTTSYDVFADATYKVTDQFEVSAGIRYSNDDKRSGYRGTLDNGGSILTSGSAANAANPATARGIFLQSTPGGLAQYRSFSDSGVTYRVVGRYAVSDDISLFATYSRGRRPEVLSPAAPVAPQGNVRFTAVAAEIVDSYEAGAKTQWLDRSLSLEGSIYRFTYTNFQTSIQTAPGVFQTISAGDASSTGFEGQFNWKPTGQLSVFGTYGYNNGRFDNGRFKGNSFRLSPDHTASFGLNFTVPVWEGDLSFLPTYTWQSRVFFDNDNDIPALQSTGDLIQDEVQGAYGLLNLRVSYQPTDANWRVEASASNLLDQEYIKDAGNTGGAFGIPTFIAGEPRYFGASFSIRY
ncbi:MAG: TonB-dependent receptor [Phenylobacterium sp.]|nr:TonB-dependent receptor [Phenylobacterium sp.]MCA6324550.1 TonB-dependent receptor [Phenylobacterium sp.]MCA6340544.1 TonB-dependent receptor [Phenylobacterium sp.]MCA6342650.1 TonB-dependent receptor [Phenylobacterium sp.]MCA6344894.1 TonB-dependent receptor [Phenylobacterium sp.]